MPDVPVARSDPADDGAPLTTVADEPTDVETPAKAIKKGSLRDRMKAFLVDDGITGAGAISPRF